MLRKLSFLNYLEVEINMFCLNFRAQSKIIFKYERKNIFFIFQFFEIKVMFALVWFVEFFKKMIFVEISFFSKFRMYFHHALFENKQKCLN